MPMNLTPCRQCSANVVGDLYIDAGKYNEGVDVLQEGRQ